MSSMEDSPTSQQQSYFKFIVSTKVASPAITITAAGSAKMAGGIDIATLAGSTGNETNAQAETVDNHVKITIADSGANHLMAGSYIECYSDGTNWYATGRLLRDNSSVTVVFAS